MKHFIMSSCLVLGLGTPGVGWAQSDDTVDSSKWTKVWSDEFDDDRLDQDKWSFETNCWGGGNDERQCYTDKDKNVYVSDGTLKITAIRERVSGHALPAHLRKTNKLSKQGKTQPYSSGRICTIGKGDWRYGRFDIRAKLPGGQGVWPAIWMLPSDQHYGTWAASGEIDIRGMRKL